MYRFPLGSLQYHLDLAVSRTYPTFAMFTNKEIFTTVLLFSLLISTWADASSQVPLPYASSYEQVDNSVNHELQDVDSVPGSYVQHFDKGSDGYKIQSGYEGYIIPAKTNKVTSIKEGILLHIVNFLEPIVKLGHAVLPKVGLVLVSVLALLLVGTLLTSCICAYTSMCHMTFLGFDLTKDQMRGFFNQDSLTEVAQFVRSAVKKYQDLQGKHSEEQKQIDGNKLK